MLKLVAEGNLTKDIEVKQTSTGLNVGKTTIASNKRNGEADYLDITIWENNLDNCLEFTKGSRVIVTGELQSRKWTGNDGVTRIAWQLVASSIVPKKKTEAEETPVTEKKAAPAPAKAAPAPAAQVKKEQPKPVATKAAAGFVDAEDDDDDLPF